ncbi:MAG: hypothetical protein JWL61_180 [Gemmatimonadetes bacterium]|jgi:hypothetical protein|nr:hypothetical protein [Gemmatimonadota bacterium]
MNTFRRITTSAAALLAVLGCSNGSAHTPAIDESVAGRLVGTWDITFVLERPLSLSTDTRKLPRSVAGTVALLERGAEPLSFEQMSAPTHMGVFHVDLGALGFPPSDAGVPDLVARVASSQRGNSMQERDSVYIVLNPETPRYAVRLSGRFDANDASGTWIAESFLGGGGTFVMRRR